MTRQWEADVEISGEEASRRIARRFPALVPIQIESLGTGWDNAAFLINRRFVFRFPRRRIAADLIVRENRILPLLAPHLPLPIPVPAFLGEPDADYPYPFAGYPLLPGTTACRLAWSEEERIRNAVPLARFLAALHTLPVNVATRAWAPGDDIERADLKKRVPLFKQRLEAVAPSLPDIEIDALHSLADRLENTPPHAGPPCWVHGDLYARHLLADDTHRLCGVIDWGDVHLGDPALDLSIAFSFLPPTARSSFRNAYGPIDAAAWDRARFRALSYGAILIAYGADIGDEAIRSAGEYALRSAQTEAE